MKSLLLAVLLCVAGVNANGDDWGPYVYRSPIVNQFVVMIQPAQIVPYYYYVPVVVIAPVTPQYFPVTTYQNVLVERRYSCFFKRYEVVTVPQTLYIPNRY